MKGRKNILQKILAGCMAVTLSVGGISVPACAMEEKEGVVQEEIDQAFLETEKMNVLSETEQEGQTYEPVYVTVGDTSTYTSEDGTVKMAYVSMNDITLAEDIPVTGDCGEVNELEINGSSEDFFHDCSTNYGFQQLDTRENAEDLKALYVNILTVLQETYYNVNDIEKSNFGGEEYYCAGRVDYSTLELTNEELFQVYTTVLYDHPLVYFTNNTIMYDGMVLYMIMDENFARGTVRADYNAKINMVMAEFEALTATADSNYEIAKLVHDEIAQTVDYAFEADGVTPKNNGPVHSIAGYVSEEKEVVCDGYAKTFGAVLNYLDIENIFVTGRGGQREIENSDGTTHAWNMVKLGNGSYYYVDVTFDDGGDLGIFDTYLCAGQEFLEDHDILENGVDGNIVYFMYELPACAKEKFTRKDTLVKAQEPEFKLSIIKEEEYMKNAHGKPCGENLYYELSKDGVMTISGMGKMWDFRDDSTAIWCFDYHKCPWEEQRDKIKSVVFQSGISYIGADAFAYCKNLTKVTFCDTVESIAPFAFWGCKKLGNFKLPERLNVIGQQAFGGSEKLTSIVIPDSVTFLDSGICEDDINLRYAYIGGKKDAGSYVFSNSPFRNCTSLEKIEVSENNISLCSIDGVLYTNRDTTLNDYEKGSIMLVQYPCGKKGKQYTLADKTAEIEQFAVEGAQYLEEINIPGTVQRIGICAIWCCPNLKSLTIPARVQSIGEDNGKFCDNLKYIKNQSKAKMSLTYFYLGEDESKWYQYWKNKETNKIIEELGKGVAVPAYFGREMCLGECFQVDGITYQMITDSQGRMLSAEEINKGKPLGKVIVYDVSEGSNYTVPDVVEYLGWKYEVSKTASTAYKITYKLKGGTNHKENPASYTNKDVILKAPQKKGYTFEGWYLDKNYKKKITKISGKRKKNITVYAKWKKVSKPEKPVIKSLENTKGSKLKLVLKKKATDVKGFEMVYSTDKAMKKSVKKAGFTSTSKTVSKLKKGKTYYVKVRAYKLDSAGEKVYGSYSNVKKVQIKK